MRLLALVILVLLLLIKHHANASSLECFTDEPRRYEFEIGSQRAGRYEVKIEHHTGRLAGMTYSFVISDVASLKSYDDYLVKRYTNGTPYTITYALRCKQLE